MNATRVRETAYDKNVAAQWDDAHRYTPTARHRRRLILKTIAPLTFRDVLDAGCAQPFLLREIVNRFGVTGYGCDLADTVIAANQQQNPDLHLRALDLTTERWPDAQQFDLVISSEVLEHIIEWQEALRNLVRMSRRYLLITVPGGTMYPAQQMLGHYRHYRGPELVNILKDEGCSIMMVRRWGFPMYNLYERLITRIAPDKLYPMFCSGEREYNVVQKAASHLLYVMFYLNDLFPKGDQLVVLARTRQETGVDAR